MLDRNIGGDGFLPPKRQGVKPGPISKTHKSADIARRQIRPRARWACAARSWPAEALADGGVENRQHHARRVVDAAGPITRLIAPKAR